MKLLGLFLISCVFTKKTLANFRDMEILHKRGNRKVQKNIILSMFEQKLFNLPCWPDINEHTAKEISQWSDLVEPLDWFPPLLCKIIWLYNRKFVKLLGSFLIRCAFTKKILGAQKFVKTGTGKNRGFPEHCAMGKNSGDRNGICRYVQAQALN